MSPNLWTILSALVGCAPVYNRYVLRSPMSEGEFWLCAVVLVLLWIGRELSLLREAA